MSLFMFPFPRKAVIADEKKALFKAKWIKICPEFSPELKKAITAFAGRVKEYMPENIEVTAGCPGAGKALLTIKPVAAELRDQEYHLQSSREGVVLSGGGESGIFYGLRTLEQILQQTGIFIPEFSIEDYPDFSERGYMLDVSRCKVPKMEELYKFVDMLAMLKYNQLQLYMEHTFAFAAHETVWHDSSPFTSQEILELDQYCRERFIELVPNFNSFGHLERWLRFDEYKHLAECPDGFMGPDGKPRDHGSVIKPNDESIEFLDSLYSEFLPNFSSKKFNIGCDETWELGRGWSKELCDEKGKTRVYLDFVAKINELANKYGCEVMFWGDIILHQPELIKELPGNITALNWGYEGTHPYKTEAPGFAKAGVPFYVCPGTSAWLTISGRTDNCIQNLINATENGKANGAVGCLLTDWGDCGHHQYLPVSWVGICASAAYSWCLEVNRHADIAEAIDLLIVNDCSGVIGEFLMTFGNLYKLCNCNQENGSPLGRAMFMELDEKPDWLEELPVADVYNVQKQLGRLEEHLSTALPESEDGKLVIEELTNAVNMMKCSLMKLLVMKGEDVDLQEFKNLMRHVIGKHEQLWLARNRQGGLRESSGVLRKMLEEINTLAQK